MERITRYIALITLAILVISILAVAGNVYVQTIPKPSVPEFTLKYADDSYDVPTTQSTDPYTGQIITHQGYHVNLTVFEMVIQNQLNPINNLYYNIQVKGHYSNEWIMFFDLSEGLPLQDSTTMETIIKMGTLGQDGLTLQGAHKTIIIPPGGKEDIQVQALIGSIGRNESSPWAPYTFYGTESEWSVAQTITIPYSLPSVTPVTSSTDLLPNMGPTSPPNPNSDLTITLALVAVAILAFVVISLVLYVRHLKKSIGSTTDKQPTKN